jgi:hypothetical protein
VRLEAVTAELRPRSDWESIDLGLALVRRDFWALSGAWWLGMAPVLLLLPLLWQHPFWFGFVFWWWIPVGSRLALFKLSRILFGDRPGWGELLRELPRAVGRRFFHRMLWARLSPWRPLTGPVEDLEGLSGKKYRDRCRVLMRRGDSSVIVLGMWRLVLTVWLAITLFCTGLLFVPENAASGWQEVMALWWDGEGVTPPAGFSFVVMASLCLSMGLVDLFSTGSGFGIYVNHRTWVEGWDVELAFRRLGNRLSGIAGLVMAGLVMGLGAMDVVRAADPQQVVEEVLKDPDFKVHTETRGHWEPDFNWWPDWGLGGGGGVIDVVVMFLKIAFFGGIAALLVWLIHRYRHLFAGRGGGAKAPAVKAARVVMGMEVTPESLPDDVAASALRAWREGRRHEALSLLYRGAISWMIRHGGVEIAESDTENDCLGRIRRARAGHVDYFSELTREWVRLAYAREVPEDVRVESLCGRWPFGEGRAS